METTPVEQKPVEKSVIETIPERVEAVQKENPDEFYPSDKFSSWMKFYFDKGNKTTYMNATQSAIAAYNHSPEQYETSVQVASYNLRKLKKMMVVFADEKGISPKSLFDFAAEKMFASKSEKIQMGWWDRICQIMEMMPEKPVENNVTVPVQINNFAKDIFDKFR